MEWVSLLEEIRPVRGNLDFRGGDPMVVGIRIVPPMNKTSFAILGELKTSKVILNVFALLAKIRRVNDVLKGFIETALQANEHKPWHFHLRSQ